MAISLNPIKLITEFKTGKFCYPNPTNYSGTYTYTNNTVAIASSVSDSNGLVTVTTSAAHNFNSGFAIKIIGASPDEFNGVKIITVTGSTTFTYWVGLGNASTSGGGTYCWDVNNACTAVGTSTLADTQFFNGAFLYYPELNNIGQVRQILSPTRWIFENPFLDKDGVPVSANYASAMYIVPSTYLRGIDIDNQGGADGKFNNNTFAADDPSINLWNDQGIYPVCGDATGTSFKITIKL